MKYLLSFVIIALVFNGCQQKKNTFADDLLMKNLNEVIVSDSEIKDLPSGRLIKSFGEKYPTSVEFYDSLLYITMAKSDTCIYVYNMNCGKLEGTMGNLGYGPNDVLSPDLMMNSNALKTKFGGIVYYDLNFKRVLLAKGKNQLLPIASINELMHPSRDLSMGNRYWVGQKIDMKNESLCQIYDSTTNMTQIIETYPKIQEINEKVDKNYLYSSKIALNEKKNRIVLGMYFWDIIQIYDLNGRKIKTFSLIQDYDAEGSMKRMFEGEDYTGFNQMYATDSYCYLRRVLTDGKTRNAKKMQIIQMDWDGNVTSIYQLDDLMIGRFSVDENSGTIIGIVQQVNEEIEEYYNIMSYKI